MRLVSVSPCVYGGGMKEKSYFDKRKIVHSNGNLVVLQLEKLSCGSCRRGWDDGSLPHPAVSGVKCTHGTGVWQVGRYGPRGGWKPMTDRYHSMDAAILMCDAFISAALMPATGVS